MSRTITLTMEVTDEEGQAIFDKFMQEASAVVHTGTTAPTVAENNTVTNVTPKGGEVPTGETDERGVVWHPDFHASTKTMTKKGAWKKKKGADDKALEAYEKGFTQSASPMANMQPTDTSVTQPVEAQAGDPLDIPAFMQRNDDGTPRFPDAQAAQATQTMPTMPTADAPATMPGAGMPMPGAGMPQPAPEPVTYEDMMASFRALGQRVGDGPAIAFVNQIYGQLNITDPNVLTTDETLRRQVKEQLDAHGV